MSASGLSIYAEVGLVLFLLAFIAVALRVLFPGKDDNYEDASLIPLRDEPVTPRQTREESWQEPSK